MNEPHTAGVEADAAVGIRTGGAVLEVAFDGAANLGQLAAYLMVTPCLELHLQQMVVREADKETVIEE